MSSIAVAPPSGLSQVERVIDTFVAPSKTFRDILRSAACWLPLILTICSLFATSVVTDRQVGFDRVYENSLHESPKQEDAMNQLSPEDRAKRVDIGIKVTRYITYAIPVIIIAVQAIYSLILWGLFNFALGAETKFKQVFAVSIYSLLPYIITSLLTILTIYFGNNADTFNQRNPVGTNLAYYLPTLAPWFKAFLTQIDIIRLWTLLLVILGMSIIARKSMIQSALIVGGLWLIGVLVEVGSAAAFS